MISPAGTNIRVWSLFPGTGEPQVPQNHVCQSDPGLLQVEIRYSPRTRRNASFATTSTP